MYAYTLQAVLYNQQKANQNYINKKSWITKKKLTH